MKNSRLLNQIVGGSYEADERIAGCAVSQNLYAESVEEASNGSYYTTALRSVDGERVVLSDFVDGDGAKGCRGMFTASDESIFAAFGESVYRISIFLKEYFRSNSLLLKFERKVRRDDQSGYASMLVYVKLP